MENGERELDILALTSAGNSSSGDDVSDGDNTNNMRMSLMSSRRIIGGAGGREGDRWVRRWEEAKSKEGG